MQRGHAIECRICAEDPDAGFAPALGRVEALQLPGGPSVRLDSALCAGIEVTRYYDPMLAKLCVSGPDRPTAIARMLQALVGAQDRGGPDERRLPAASAQKPRRSRPETTRPTLIPELQRRGRRARREDLAIVAGVVLEHLERSAARPGGGASGRQASSAWKQSGRPVR